MKTIAILFFTISCLLGTTFQIRAADDTLNNSGVIDMKQLGLGDGVLIEKIKTSQCNFDTSLAGLKQLKAAGVSDAVITAMLSVHAPAAVSAAPAATVTATTSTDPNDPNAPHEAGIWSYETIGGKGKMTQLEPSVYSQGRSGSMIFMGWGATVKQQAVIRSAHAVTATANRQPVYYFYFEHTEAGLSDSHGATSPNEYILAQFEVAEKDNQRRLVIGSLNAYSGGTSGTDAQSIRSFDYEKISPGAYKVTVKTPLADGEYGFFYGGAGAGGYGIFAAGATGGKVFDFGVKGSASTQPKPAAATATQPKPATATATATTTQPATASASASVSVSVTETNAPAAKKHTFNLFHKKSSATNQPPAASTNK